VDASADGAEEELVEASRRDDDIRELGGIDVEREEASCEIEENEACSWSSD
jgi:hypothetical protein